MGKKRGSTGENTAKEFTKVGLGETKKKILGKKIALFPDGPVCVRTSVPGVGARCRWALRMMDTCTQLWSPEQGKQEATLQPG